MRSRAYAVFAVVMKRCLVWAVVLHGALAHAQQEQQTESTPLHRLVHRHALLVRYNPLGLVYDGRVAWRLRLYEHASRALRDNFVSLGVALNVTPANLRVGPVLELNPATVLSLAATVRFVQFFGTFNNLQGFPGAQAEYSESTLRANADHRLVTNGWDAMLSATLQAKVWSLVARNSARLIYESQRLHDGDRVFYDGTFDVLAPNRGWFFIDDAELGYQTPDGKLIIGARYTATVPLYEPARHDDPLLGAEPANDTHRVGPFAAYTFFTQEGARLNAPTVFVAVQWWVKHRYRAGAESSAALPLIGAGFQITGDLLPAK